MANTSNVTATLKLPAFQIRVLVSFILSRMLKLCLCLELML